VQECVLCCGVKVRSIDPCVSGKQVELKEKKKRNFTNPARETAYDRSEEAKRLRVET
jgi:hypothetical protein